MTRVAILEQDPLFATELRVAVESAGFQPDCFSETESALADVRRHAFALAIVDLEIHDADAFAVCSETSRLMPVIAITSMRGEETCLRALTSGADDCLVRPFPPRELGARIRNLLRRVGSSDDDTSELAQAVISMRVQSGGTTYALSRGEAEILALLLESRGSLLTVSQMLERLPSHSRVKRGTIESRIKSLRRKLGAERLLSRGRFGYQLVGE